MSGRRAFTDEDLTAYLDGEADETLRGELEKALAQDAKLQERIEALGADTGSIRKAFDALLVEAPTPPPILDDWTPSQSRRNPAVAGAVAATAVACLLLGVAVGWVYKASQDTTWQAFAAAYHALYVTRTLSEIDQPRDAARAELARVSEALGKQVKFEKIGEIEQLDYKRAQVLGFRGRPLVQLAFLSKLGAPVALCIIRSNGRRGMAVRMTRMHEMSAAQWIKDGYEYLLIGGDDDAMLKMAAAHFSEQL